MIIYTNENELYHHGVLGMKWGVRRYQNYDGTYTKKGMEHYRESEAKYKSAKEVHKFAKDAYKSTKKRGSYNVNGKEIAVSKNVVKEAKANVKSAKKQLSKDYDQLRRDKAGDKGKALYRSGKTITGNNASWRRAEVIAAGTSLAAYYLAQNGNKKLATYTGALGLGMEVANGIMGVKNTVENHYLRAYYGHSRPNRN